MKRVLLVHWKEAEIPERAARLKKLRLGVEPYCVQGGAGLRELGDDPPDAFVIDLSRLPSHGRTVAYVLRQQKSTRRIPIVFVGGEADKIAKVRSLIPDAIYTDWLHIAGAIKKAFAWKSTNPIVPKSTSGYSGTPLPKKLGVTGGRAVILLHAPKGFESQLGGEDGPSRIIRGVRGQADVVIWFVKGMRDLRSRLPVAKKAMAEGGAMWIAWPKKASGVKTDVSERSVRETGLAAGLVDYKVCAIDETWSGLKFARRKKR